MQGPAQPPPPRRRKNPRDQNPSSAASFCLLCMGIVLVIPGAAIAGISFRNDDSFSEGLSITMKIAGLVLLGVGVVLISLGCCICCRLCNKAPAPPEQPTNQTIILRTPRSNQAVQQHFTPDGHVVMGYAPPTSGVASATGGGYMPMTPQAAGPPPQLFHPSMQMAYPPPMPGQYPDVGAGPQPQYPSPYSPPPGQYPAAPYNPAHAPPPLLQAGYPQSPLTFPSQLAQPVVSFPQTYNPPLHEVMPSAHEVTPSAPPAEHTLSRPPPYEEVAGEHHRL